MGDCGRVRQTGMTSSSRCLGVAPRQWTSSRLTRWEGRGAHDLMLMQCCYVQYGCGGVALVEYIEDLNSRYGKPVWLTGVWLVWHTSEVMMMMSR